MWVRCSVLQKALCYMAPSAALAMPPHLKLDSIKTRLRFNLEVRVTEVSQPWKQVLACKGHVRRLFDKVSGWLGLQKKSVKPDVDQETLNSLQTSSVSSREYSL